MNVGVLSLPAGSGPKIPAIPAEGRPHDPGSMEAASFQGSGRACMLHP